MIKHSRNKNRFFYASTGVSYFFSFLDRYKLINIKNVCKQVYFFYRKITISFRSQPTFLVIGAKRCGTTTLYRALCQHPNIKAALKKEIHYFDLHYEKGKKWYRLFFPFKSSKYITGEATPTYLTDKKAIDRIIQMYPNIRIICLLREPVSRAFSEYKIDKHHNRVNKSFERIISEAEQGVGGIWACQYMDRSNYAKYIEYVFSHISNKQCMVIQSEIFYAQPQDTISNIYKFLELPDYIVSDTTSLLSNNATGTSETLSEDIKNKLHKLFISKDKALEDILMNSDAVSMWNRKKYE